MSDDITDRLQVAAKNRPGAGDVMLRRWIDEATAEIVRLRTRVAELEAAERAEAGQLMGLWQDERALADQLSEALRASYAMDMTHLQRVQAHNMTVRALAAYDRARTPATQEPT